MATLYHRTPILDFGLTQVGIGAARDPEGGWISVMDVTEGKGGGKRPAGRGPAVVIYPVDKQKDVPVAFGGEVPNPVPEAKDGAGYPVTAQFPSGVPVKAARAVLKDAEGKPLDGWVSSPESPADARFQRGTVCVFAKQAFAPGATYTVEMTEADLDVLDEGGRPGRGGEVAEDRPRVARESRAAPSAHLPGAGPIPPAALAAASPATGLTTTTIVFRGA